MVVGRGARASRALLNRLPVTNGGQGDVVGSPNQAPWVALKVYLRGMPRGRGGSRVEAVRSSYCRSQADGQYVKGVPWRLQSGDALVQSRCCSFHLKRCHLNIPQEESCLYVESYPKMLSGVEGWH